MADTNISTVALAKQLFTLLLRSVMPLSLEGLPASIVMLRFILDMTETPPS